MQGKIPRHALNVGNRWLNVTFWIAQAALLLFWLSLNIAGIKKGIWQMNAQQVPFSKMMDGLRPWFGIFVSSGVILATALFILAFTLLRSFFSGKAGKGTKEIPGKLPAEQMDKINII